VLFLYATSFRYVQPNFRCFGAVLPLCKPYISSGYEGFITVYMAIADSELAAIEAAMRDRPEGVSMGDLVGLGASEAQRRAMQRRLKKLIDQRRVFTSGVAKHMRYFLVGQPGPPTLIHKEEAHLESEGGFFVPVSKTGQELQGLIRRPERDRSPVPYQREFLSNYQPNSTYFLSPRERKYLAEIGVVEVGVGLPAGTYARHILDRLLIDLSWNSSRLEGNTYSILDTHLLLDRGKIAEGKSAEETQMIINHKEAIEFLVEAAGDIGFNRHTILNLHAFLSNNLLDPQASGRLRQGYCHWEISLYAIAGAVSNRGVF